MGCFDKQCQFSAYRLSKYSVQLERGALLPPGWPDLTLIVTSSLPTLREIVLELDSLDLSLPDVIVDLDRPSPSERACTEASACQ